MNLYTAAVFSNSYHSGQNRYVKLNEVERDIMDNGVPFELESYAYVGDQRAVDHMRTNKAQIFLDSGAFTAHTKGIEITVLEYVDYIKRNEDLIRKENGVMMASVLDAIGDELKTYQNQLAMEALGAKPLPCFHAGEDLRYCELYATNYEYITLGGLVGSTTEALIDWLDEVWNRCLVDGAGRPKCKVHGFGITSIPIMNRYPWQSCDSSSWIQTASFGGIMTTQWGPISVSTKSPSRHVEGQHISTYSPIEQQAIHRMIEGNGFNVDRLSTVYESRAVWNLKAYKDLGNNVTSRAPERFVKEQPGFF